MRGAHYACFCCLESASSFLFLTWIGAGARNHRHARREQQHQKRDCDPETGRCEDAEIPFHCRCFGKTAPGENGRADAQVPAPVSAQRVMTQRRCALWTFAARAKVNRWFTMSRAFYSKSSDRCY